MRIIAGTKRGMKLFSPAGRVSRPITDRVKEALFSVIYKYDLPVGAVVADLFCGVGSLGLEAISRGAEYVTFVEQDRDVAATLQKNIDKACFGNCSKLIKGDVFTAVGRFANSGHGQCNLVFVDPPYVLSANTGPDSPITGLMNLLSEQVRDGGFVILRTASKTVLPDQYGKLKLLERRQWGTMTCMIYTKAKND
jgi:16S rRNA (guanine966-N2)-methyltransferase